MFAAEGHDRANSFRFADHLVEGRFFFTFFTSAFFVGVNGHRFALDRFRRFAGARAFLGRFCVAGSFGERAAREGDDLGGVLRVGQRARRVTRLARESCFAGDFECRRAARAAEAVDHLFIRACTLGFLLVDRQFRAVFGVPAVLEVRHAFGRVRHPFVLAGLGFFVLAADLYPDAFRTGAFGDEFAPLLRLAFAPFLAIGRAAHMARVGQLGDARLRGFSRRDRDARGRRFAVDSNRFFDRFPTGGRIVPPDRLRAVQFAVFVSNLGEARFFTVVDLKIRRVRVPERDASDRRAVGAHGHLSGATAAFDR